MSDEPIYNIKIAQISIVCMCKKIGSAFPKVHHASEFARAIDVFAPRYRPLTFIVMLVLPSTVRSTHVVSYNKIPGTLAKKDITILFPRK